MTHIATVKFVNFQKGPSYSYFTDLSLESGDYVVVEVRDSFSVALVDDPDVTNPDVAARALRFILTKVDIDTALRRVDALRKES